MTLEVWQGFAQNDAGDVLDTATVTVTLAGTATKPDLFADADGVSSKTNPFNTDSTGFVQFYTAPAIVDIVATKGAFTVTFSNVRIGLPDALQTVATLAELDAITSATDGEVRQVTQFDTGTEYGGGEFIYDATSTDTLFEGMTQAPAIGSGRFKRNTGEAVQSEWFGIKHHATFDNSARVQEMMDFMGYSNRNECVFSTGDSPIVIANKVNIPDFLFPDQVTRKTGIQMRGGHQRGTRLHSDVTSDYMFGNFGNDFSSARLMGFSSDSTIGGTGGGIFECVEGYMGLFEDINFAGIPAEYWAIDNDPGVLGIFSLVLNRVRFGSDNGAASLRYNGGAVNHAGTHGLMLNNCYINSVRTDTFQTGHASRVTGGDYTTLDGSGYAINASGYRRPLGIIRVTNCVNVTMDHITFEGRPTTGMNHGMHFVAFDGTVQDVKVGNFHGESTCTAYFKTVTGSVSNAIVDTGLAWFKTIDGHFNPNSMVWDGRANDNVRFKNLRPKTDDTAAVDATSGGYNYNNEGYWIRNGERYAKGLVENFTDDGSGAQAGRPVNGTYYDSVQPVSTSFVNSSGNTITSTYQLKQSGITEIDFTCYRSAGTTSPNLISSKFRAVWIPDFELGTTPVNSVDVIGTAVTAGAGVYKPSSMTASVSATGLVTFVVTLAGTPAATTYGVSLTVLPIKQFAAL